MGRYENFIISLDIRGYDNNVQEISKAMSLNCTYFFNENNRKMQRKKTIEDIDVKGKKIFGCIIYGVMNESQITKDLN